MSKMDNKKRIENVQPLRTNKEIQEMILAIRRGNGSYPKNKKIAERDILMFLVGINTGLRISDILKLKVKYVKRSEEHTSELQSRGHLVCRLLLEKKKEK